MRKAIMSSCLDENFSYLWLDSSEKLINPGLIHSAAWDDYAVRLPGDAVWELIAPAVPDVLQSLGKNVYEAKWWTPVPLMEVEFLLRAEGITIIGAPYEPDDLPKGCAVRFSIESPHPM
jgi:hypothetical protein